MSMNRRPARHEKGLRVRTVKSIPTKKSRMKMESVLHILHLEGDPTDAALVQSTLKAGGITCATIRVVACNRADFVSGAGAGRH